MDLDVEKILDVSASLAIAVAAIIQMSRAHAECRRHQAEMAAELLALLKELARRTMTSTPVLPNDR